MNQKRISVLSTIFIVAMAVLLAGTVPAAAQAEQLHFTGTNCIYPQSPPERSWVSDDGILHQRGMGMISINVADSDYLTGIMIVNGNIDLNLATGDGHTYGTLTIYPEAYNGTFEGNWTSHISADSLRGTVVAHGTGELEGMQLFGDLSGESPLINPCTNGDMTILIP